VSLRYEIVDSDGSTESGPHEKEFDSVEDMNYWIRQQNGHPFLSIKTLSVREF
jgi:hypothetical protein